MITGLRINPRLKPNTKEQVKYTLEPYDEAKGPIRAMQKFTVILMTTQGTDSFRPWIGTQMPAICRMNVINSQEMRLFIKEQLENAITQFFRLQAEESQQNSQTAFDVITDIEIVAVDIGKTNRITITVKFTPATRESIVYSLQV